MKRILVIIFIKIAIVSASFGQVITQDSLALVALYDSLNGPAWFNNANWKTGSVTNWGSGLVVVQGNRVTKLYLNGNNLSGSLPSQIADLTALKELWFSDNNISGSIPSLIDGMSALEILGMDHNAFTGPIPPEIGNMTNLNTIYLNHNQLDDTIPGELGMLSVLHTLFVNSNNLTGSIPKDLKDLSQLSSLGVNDNALTGIPDELGSITSLNKLYLNGNQFSGPIPDTLYNLTGLVELFLDDNQFTGQVSSRISNLTFLTYFGIQNNQIGGVVPDEVGDLSFLLGLYLNGNQITSVTDSISTIPNLLYLQLNDNLLEDLPKLDTLQPFLEINVSNNLLTFDDLEPLVQLGVDSTKYSPQAMVLMMDSIVKDTDSSFTISSSIGGSANTYQWFHSGDTVVGDTNATLMIDQVAVADSGSYTCSITSTLVPNLTLIRRPVQLSIIDHTGINQVMGRWNLKVYPNPTTDLVNIELQDCMDCKNIDHINVFDQMGKLIISKHINGQNRIRLNTETFSPGTYYFQLGGTEIFHSKQYVGTLNVVR